MLRVVTLFALVILAACVDLQDAQSAGGDRVFSIEGLVCEGPRPIVFSPDGEWLLLTTTREVPNEVLPRSEILLLRRGSGDPIRPDAADEKTASLLAAGRYPRTDRACWSDAETVHFPVSISVLRKRDIGAATPAELTSFVVHLSQPDKLQAGVVPSGCWRPSWSQWRYESPETTAGTGNQIDGIRLEGTAPTLKLVTDDGRFIATHVAHNSMADQIVLAAYSWSPNGSRVAYLLAENAGSVGRPSSLWLKRSMRSDPEPLGTGVYSVQWRDENTLFGCGRIGGERPLSVIRWTVDE